jgi:glycosyltransferase involved in cell wall biosynthesis/CMP-N-acetylneuraminic acid synthetase
MPKVTVYIPTHNYGRYLERSIKSIYRQNYDDWELIVIDDGSTDNTREILARFERYPKIQIHYQENLGLNRTNNRAIRMSCGEYIMRLDADDYLDENAFIVMANLLDKKPDVAMVYPDYFVVSEDEELIRLERRSKIYEEDELLDLPSHAACAMIRKKCLEELDGYNENFLCQDGYDLWIRLIQKYKVYNLNLPLFYYRRHNGSITSSSDKILRARQKIKREFVRKSGNDLPKVMAIIPVRDDSTETKSALAMQQLAGTKVLDYTIKAALDSKMLDRIVVTSEDQHVLDYSKNFEGIEPIKRSEELGKQNYPIEPTVVNILSELDKIDGYAPDAVMLLFPLSPLRKARHIQKAIDTLLIFECDSVVSVYEDNHYYYRRSKYGLKPIYNERKLRIEREVFYVDNAAILLSWTNAVSVRSFIGERVSHILMTPEESYKIDTDFQFWMVEQIIQKRVIEKGNQ